MGARRHRGLQGTLHGQEHYKQVVSHISGYFVIGLHGKFNKNFVVRTILHRRN
jgi:hypothetical protein